jgi:hypothetical protein
MRLAPPVEGACARGRVLNRRSASSFGTNKSSPQRTTTATPNSSQRAQTRQRNNCAHMCPPCGSSRERRRIHRGKSSRSRRPQRTQLIPPRRSRVALGLPADTLIHQANRCSHLHLRAMYVWCSIPKIHHAYVLSWTITTARSTRQMALHTLHPRKTSRR